MDFYGVLPGYPLIIKYQESLKIRKKYQRGFVFTSNRVLIPAQFPPFERFDNFGKRFSEYHE
jgi:hypothetical protein